MAAAKRKTEAATSVGIGFFTGHGYELQANQEVAWQYVHCAGCDVDENGVERYHHLEKIPCNCPPGPQERAITCEADEVAFLGGRGSMKTETAIAFLFKGNYGRVQAGDNTDVSYLYNPHYSALILRKTQDDLDDFFHRLVKVPIIAANIENKSEKPFDIKFKSGARFNFGHLQDARSFEAVQGKEYTRIAIEELGQIGSEELYLMILGSCRTKHRGMFAQSFATANPGGPGNKFIKARFMRTLRGEKRPPGRVVSQDGKTRVYFHSTVLDNPYYLAGNKDYVKYLKSLRGTLREHWLEGNFDVAEGQFFEHFRSEHRAHEEPNACHVLKSAKERPEPIELPGWWPRAIGCDWGYSHNSVVLWGCWHPKGQLHVYRELSVARTGTVALGAQIALNSIPDLEKMPNQHLTVFLSPDAFASTDDTNTEAEQIAKGVNTILGNDAAFVLAPTQDEKTMSEEEAYASMLRRQREFSSKTHITLVRANNKRKPGWNLMREYLRWWPLFEQGESFDEAKGREILLKHGVLAYHEYKQRFEKQKNETLPKIQIWDCCKDTIRFFEEAIEKENDREDVLKTDAALDDAGDGLRYLVMGFPFQQAEEPRDVFIRRKLTGLQGIDGTDLVMAARQFEWQYDQQHAAALQGITIPRRAGPALRRAMARVM
jgi:hypothetical protein